MATSFIGRTDLPRGIRNNNPGNIKDDGTAWQGVTGNDGTFYIFQDDTWGIRALSTDLANKILEGNNTITEIISIYAPPSENDTASYIASVAADTSLDPNQVLTADQGTLHALIRAIMNHENGDAASALIPDADIDQGISMMNPSILQTLQAAGIAIQSSIEDTSGDVSTTGLLVIGGIILLLLFARE
jgi:hypothetical protein